MKPKQLVMLGLMTVMLGIFSSLTSAQTPSPQYEEPGSASHSAGYDWQFGSSLTYSTGDFGTSETTDTVYWPFSVQRFFEQGDVTLTVPFLYQNSGPGVSAIGGRPFSTNQNFINDGDGGIGDVLLKGRYYLLNDTPDRFGLSTIGQIKFPTADEDKGLGTGEFDETFGLEASKHLQAPWTLYGDMYFTHIGDPPGVHLDNEFAFDAGVGYDLTDATQATLFYAERTALLDNRDNPRDVILGVNHDLNQQTNLYGDLGIGASDGSPDVSVTMGMAYLY